MQTPETLGIIAGNGVYPLLLAEAARAAGVKKIVAAAFTDETDPAHRATSRRDRMAARRAARPNVEFFREQNVRSGHHGWTDRAEKSVRSAAGLESAALARETCSGAMPNQFSRAIGGRVGESWDRDVAGDNFSRANLLRPLGLIAGPEIIPARRRRCRFRMGDRKRNQPARYRADRHREEWHSARGGSVRRHERSDQTRRNAWPQKRDHGQSREAKSGYALRCAGDRSRNDSHCSRSRIARDRGGSRQNSIARKGVR